MPRDLSFVRFIRPVGTDKNSDIRAVFLQLLLSLFSRPFNKLGAIVIQSDFEDVACMGLTSGQFCHV
jgi:hypothetical protein